MFREYNPLTRTAFEDVEHEYVDTKTGEVVHTVETKAARYGRPKYYRANKGAFYQALSALDATSIKIALYVAENSNHENIFLGTYKDFEQIMSVSNKTVITSMIKLQENDIIRMAHPAQWMFNPTLAVSCYDDMVPSLIAKYYALAPYGERRQKKNKTESEEQINVVRRTDQSGGPAEESSDTDSPVPDGTR